MRLVFVAVPALHVTMFADQREVCCVVVKFRVCPVIRVVTVIALRTQITVMNFVFAMASDALTGRIATFFTRLVAAGAFGIKMFTQQFKISEPMIERFFVEPKNIGVTTFVIGVTTGAGIIVNVVRPAVKTRPGGGVVGNVLVTIQAKAVLRRSIKPLMA